MKLREIITEEQKFNWDKHKPEIMRFIEETLANKPTSKERNPFYSVIAGSPTVGDAGKAGLPKEFENNWKSYFTEKPWDTDGVWSQFNMGGNFTRETGNGRTLNFYISVNKEKNNIINFFKNVHKLSSYLTPISKKYQTPVAFKTHRLLDSFVEHNDSLKVYYYDGKAKDEITAAVKQWLTDNNIATGKRTHEHGVDLKSGGGSFGQILSNHVYDVFTNLIKTNGNKYTPEKYFEWLKQHTPTIISQVKQK